MEILYTVSEREFKHGEHSAIGLKAGLNDRCIPKVLSKR
jgi:hypothetical protein